MEGVGPLSIKTEDELLTPEELKKMFKCSKVMIYKLVQSGEIPFYRPFGKCIRFKLSEIQQWIEQGKNKQWHRDLDTQNGNKE